MTTMICNWSGLGGSRCLARGSDGTCTLETVTIGGEGGFFPPNCQGIQLGEGDDTPIMLPGETIEAAKKRVLGKS